MESNHMTCYALSSRGGREANEDSVAVARSPFAALCVLADGLGGHGMGDVASQWFAVTLKKCLENGRERIWSVFKRQL